MEFSTYYVASMLIILAPKSVQACNYEFLNLNNTITVDRSSKVNTVVFTVAVNNTWTGLPAPDVKIAMESSSTRFKLDDNDTHQVQVKECLDINESCQLTLTIVNNSNCTPGILTIYTKSAIPQYEVTNTDLFTTVDMSVFDLMTYAFSIKISNDEIYGGCGSFICTSICLNNDENVTLLYNEESHAFDTRKPDIKLGFIYNLRLTCLDSLDRNFITESHNLNFNVMFCPLITAGTHQSTTALPCPTLHSFTDTERTIGKPTVSLFTKAYAKKNTKTQTTNPSISLQSKKQWLDFSTVKRPTRNIINISHREPTSDGITREKISVIQTTASNDGAMSQSPLYNNTFKTYAGHGSNGARVRTANATPTVISESSNATLSFQHTKMGHTSMELINKVTFPKLIITSTTQMTAYTAESIQENFFSKPENKATLGILVAAVTGGSLAGIIYTAYKKTLAKPSISPVFTV